MIHVERWFSWLQAERRAEHGSTLVLAAIVITCLSWPAELHAGHSRVDSESQPAWTLAAGPVTGGVSFDQDLANFRWDTRPAAQWGVHALLHRRRFAAGMRLWRARTTQSSGIPGESQAPNVNLTGVELLGSIRAFRYGGLELWGISHAGRLHLGYDPDQQTFDVGGIAEPIAVDYAPISEWEFGLGIELRKEFMSRVAVALQGERTTFALDTAHRRGNEIVQARDRFYSWNLRLQVSWLWRLS